VKDKKQTNGQTMLGDLPFRQSKHLARKSRKLTGSISFLGLLGIKKTEWKYFISGTVGELSGSISFLGLLGISHASIALM
jgi:hypothetical protein